MNSETQRIKEVYQKRKVRGADKYSIFFSRQRQEKIKEAIGKADVPLSVTTKILDVGCGEGAVLGYFLEDGIPAENLYGVDLLPERIESAKELYPKIHFTRANAERLPYPEAFFDIIIQSTVFTSILDEKMKQNVAAEMLRVLKPTGGGL